MEISEIKQKLTIEKVLNHYSLHPDKNHRLKCPFHEDKTPSFQVYPQTNTWTCFSSNCTAGSGDQIDFIMKHEKITKHEALLKATILCNGETTKKNQKPAIKNELTQEQRITALIEVFRHFVRSLDVKPEKAIKYFEERKLDYKKLSVGYDAHTFHKVKGTTEEQKKQYLQLGLLKPDKFGRVNNYHSHFDSCIVFPMLDKQGNIVNLYGRHTEKKEHHYLPGKHTGLYPNYPKAETKILILTEAIIDAATLLQVLPSLRCSEAKEAISFLALYGTNGFTDEHKEAIKEWTACLEPVERKEIILFFDGDEAGTEATKRIANELKQINEKLIITVIDTPKDEDVNSLLIGHESEIFTHLIENRKPFLFSNEKSIENKKSENTETTGDTEINQCQSVQSVSSAFHLKTSNPDCLIYETEHLQITLWGGIETHTINRLRVTLHIQLRPALSRVEVKNEYASFRDTADLYSHSQSDKLIKQAAEKLEISSTITGEAIAGLTKELEQYRQQKREEKRKEEESREQENKDLFSRSQMQEAKEFMQNPKLTEYTHKIFDNLGIIGQQDNAALLFFIFLTRFFKNPLHAIVMGSSGSGKTHLLKGVAGTVPKQHIHFTTSLSENTLYYTPKDFLKNKILLQEDLDGAYNALLPLRELMSNQSISRFSTKTNSKTGDSKQVYLYVEGPVCVAGATTKERIYEDNANRSFLIQIEDNPHYEAGVLEYQGKAAAGLINVKKYEENINLMKAAQLQIEAFEVIIPFATKLEIPQHVFKKLRTKNHYFTLIKAITLWNQKQRKRTTDNEGNTYLISTLEDVEWANYLCKESLLRKSDELGGKTRQFFESLKDLQKEGQKSNPVFYAKDIRKYFRLHPMQLKRYLDELEGRGFIKCKSRSNKTGNEYEITVWDDYEQLKNGINMLDTLLEQLKKETVKA